MADVITAPFTDEQVEMLNEWQKTGFVHAFTCLYAHSNGHLKLVATNDGWVCQDSTCPYTQDWAHWYMVDGYLLDKMRELNGI